ncbi:calcium-binding protein [Gemmobacter lutimaris]|uniref:Calcium-binding protein n=1 Tax=Gemmobacter lutimaris TaxID=2306023 RepID=A0A398BVL2_9RHOB|nr:calcium-binding protein [Gemmobacter lutimaris]RID93744.1 calcium-binding protein [Gemmobacter lutimaris]
MARETVSRLPVPETGGWRAAAEVEGTMSYQPKRILTDLVINQPSETSESDPRLTVLADGRMVAVWASSHEAAYLGLEGWDIADSYFRILGADGRPEGEVTRINTARVGSQVSAEVAALPDGGFIVTYAGVPLKSGLAQIGFQRFDATGAAVGGETIVSGDMSTFSAMNPSVAVLEDGGFLVTWQSGKNLAGGYADGDREGVYARLFDADGLAVGGSFAVTQEVTDWQQNPVALRLSDGAVLIAWHGKALDGESPALGVRARVFEEDGTPRGGEFLLNAESGSTLTSGSPQLNPSLAALPDGGFVAVWEGSAQAPDNSSWGIFARIFDADGTASDPEFGVNTARTQNQTRPEVAVLADGGFVVVWQSDFLTDGWTTAVRGQRYAADGTAVGSEFGVNQTPMSSWKYSQIDVAAQKDGGFTVTYMLADPEVTSNPYDIVVSRFAPEWFGTLAAERLLGTGKGDRLYGLAGNDSIFGQTGNDTIDGGTGHDQISGGAGNDRLTGAGGNDRLGGATGNDLLLGGTGHDTLNGDKGDDRLEGGADRDRLNGGAGADVLKGGGGADVLDGGTGRDVMTGGTGNDVFVFAKGDGGDRITDFGTGADRIDLGDLASVTSWRDLRLHHLQEGAEGVTILGGNGDRLLIAGATLASLEAADFIF